MSTPLDAAKSQLSNALMLNGEPLATPQDWAKNYQLPPDIEQPLAPARPNTSQQSTGNSLLDFWNHYVDTFGQIQDNAIDNPANTVANIAGISPNDFATGKSARGSSIFADVAAVLVGLVLIAGAVFSFSQVKDTLITTAKGAATLAA